MERAFNDNSSFFWKRFSTTRLKLISSHSCLLGGTFINGDIIHPTLLTPFSSANFGVSSSAFITAFNSTAVSAYVEADIGLAISAQVFGEWSFLFLFFFFFIEFSSYSKFNSLGTPTFYVNGVKTDFDETTTVSEWVAFIKSLISPSQESNIFWVEWKRWFFPFEIISLLEQLQEVDSMHSPQCQEFSSLFYRCNEISKRKG